MNRRYRLGVPLVVAAVLLGTAAAAGAQTQPAPSTTTTTAPGAVTPTPPGNPGHIRSTTQPVPDQYIVQLKGVPVTGVPAEASQLAGKHGGQVLHVYQHALQGFAVRMSPSQASALTDEPNVQSVTEDGVVHTSTSQSPAPDWGLDRIDQPNLPLDNAYHYGTSGSGVTAYIIDTGIQGNVPDFAGRVTFGADEINDGTMHLVDCNGHGTHVAGELGGTTYGVAKGVQLVEVRVLNCSGSGTDSGVIAGIDFVSATATRPSVANMSLGGSQNSALDAAITGSEDPVHSTGSDGHTNSNMSISAADGAFTQADVGAHITDSLGKIPTNTFINSVTDATDAVLTNPATGTVTNDVFTIGSGVTYAVAAGNGSTDACTTSPADLGGSHSATLTAAASDINDNAASFSNFGSCVDLYGPGVNITSDGTNNGTASLCPGPTCVLSGTSMATPHVAATAAIYLSANPTATPAQVKAAVTGDATPNVIVGVPAGTPNKLDFTGPSAPALTANVSSPTSVHLSWTAPTSNGGNPITGYNVYKGTTSGNVSTVLASNVSPSTTTFDDTGLTCGQTFYYEVAAVNVVDPDPTTNDARSAAATAAPCGAGFTPLTPDRLLDTRTSTGGHQSPLGPGQSLTLQVAGVDGIPMTATSVVLNVTAADETTFSFVTVYPTGEPLPLVSNLNTSASTNIANLVTVELGTGGAVNFYNAVGSTDVIADVFGYFDNNGINQEYVPQAPQRILDTRNGTGAPQAPIPPGQMIPLQVTGVGSIPTTATAVVMNVTATDATALSFLTVWPTDQPMPTTSNVNFGGGQTVPNLVEVPLSTTGMTPGAVDIYNSAGSTDVVADVAGYYVPNGTSGSLHYTAVSPTRILDTRIGLGDPGAVGAGQTITLSVAGHGGVPSSGAQAVVMNTTETDGTAISFLTLWPILAPRPLASNLNWPAGVTLPNLTNVMLGSGQVNIFNQAGSVDVIDDVAGYYESG